MKGRKLAVAKDVAETYLSIFGPDRFFIEVQKQGIKEQDMVNPELIDLAKQVCSHAGCESNPPKREMDQLLATGEQVTIALMAMAIHAQGHEAISFTGGQVGLLTDEAFSKARIQSINKQRIFKELEAGKIVIVDFARKYDPQAFHLDEEAGRNGPFGALSASGWHTASRRRPLDSAPVKSSWRATGTTPVW